MRTWKVWLTALAVGAIAAGIVYGAEAEKKAKRPPAAAAEQDDDSTVAYLGVAAGPLDPVLARHMKMKPGTGLIVTTVDPQGPSRDLLQEDDILKELDGQMLVNFDQLTTLVRLHQPGEEASLVVLREGETKKITVKLGERELPPEMEQPQIMPWPLLQNRPGWRGFNMPTPRYHQLEQPAPDEDQDAVRPPRHAAPKEKAKPKVQAEKPAPEAKGEASVSMSFSTVVSQTMDDHVVTYTDNNGQKSLKVADNAGKVLFDGPVNTDDQVKALTPQVRGFYDKIKKQAGGIEIKSKPAPAGGTPRLDA